MTTHQHNKSLTVPGIEIPRGIERFQYFLSDQYTINSVADQGETVLQHCRITFGASHDITLRVFTTGTVTLAASSQLVTSEFEGMCNQVEELARESSDTIDTPGNLPLARSKELLEYITAISSADENHRPIIVILADTIDEIVLREWLKRLVEYGQVLRAPIPDKVSAIEGNGKHVYLKDQIKSLRELRNNVIHEGQLPSQMQAITSLETATDVLRHA